MKEITFNCFKNFKCKANFCKHNCCVGWEIDIDDNSYKKYITNKGEFSKNLKNGIDRKHKCFKQDENGRCKFLNNENLCDILINMGEGSLCQVCDDHPKFRNFFSDRVEIGFGISCEKACDMLLDFNENIVQIVSENKVENFENSDFENRILSSRDYLYSILDEKVDFTVKLKKILLFCNTSLDELLFKIDIKSLLFSFERLNEMLYDKIESVCFDNELKQSNYDKLYEKLLWYFITRHVPQAIDNLDIKSRTVFSVLSTYIIIKIFEKEEKSLDNLKNISREYSAEVEYDEDNISCFLDQIDRVLIIKK